MKRIVIIILGVIILVTGGVVLGRSLEKTGDPSRVGSETLIESVKDTINDVTKSSKDAIIQQVDKRSPEEKLKSGLSGDSVVSCTVASDELSGTMYFSGSSARLSGTIAGNDYYPQMTDILSLGGTTYMWNEETQSGYTFGTNNSSVFNAESLSNLTGDEFAEAMVELGIELTSCTTAARDSSLFTVPDDVSFQPIQDRISEILQERASDAVKEGVDSLFND